MEKPKAAKLSTYPQLLFSNIFQSPRKNSETKKGANVGWDTHPEYSITRNEKIYNKEEARDTRKLFKTSHAM